MGIEHSIIDMQSSLDFKIDYIHNFDVSLMRDEITSENEATFMFSEIYFKTHDNYGNFGKIVEFINKNTNEVVAKYTSTQSVVYVPQIFIGDSKLWFNIKFDKNNPGSNPQQL